MEKKIISFKAAIYEKQYKDFYKNPNNKNLQLHIWFADTVIKSKIS